MSEIGRNDACPCGSGLKYKRCCLGLMEAEGGMGALFGSGEFEDLSLEEGGLGSGGLEALRRGVKGSPFGRETTESPIGGMDRFQRPERETRESLPLMAPSLAHAVSFADRIDGRRLYESGFVQDLSHDLLRYEAWVMDQGHEYRGSLGFEPIEDGTAGVIPECSCRSTQRQSLCQHLYAIMLCRDAELMGARLGQEPDPHSIDEVLWARLESADRISRPKTVKAPKLDDHAAHILRSVEEVAADWTKAYHGYYSSLRTSGDFEVPSDIEFDLVDDRDRFDGSDSLDGVEDGIDGLSEAGPRSPSATPKPLTADQRLRNFEYHHRPRAALDPTREAHICYLIEAQEERVFLTLTRQTRKKSGQWGTQVTLQPADIPSYILDEVDRSILVGLQGLTGGGRAPDYARGHRIQRYNRDLWEFDPQDRMEMEPSLAARLLPRMIRTGRCFLFDEDRTNPKLLPPPLVMDSGDPLRFVIVGEEKAGRARLVGELRRGTETLIGRWPWKKGAASGDTPTKSGDTPTSPDDADGEPVLLGRDHVVLGTTCYALEPIADYMLARSLIVRGPLDLPKEDRDREHYLRRFVQLPGACHLQEGPLVVRSAEPMRPRLTMEDPTGATTKYLDASIEFDYGKGHLERRELIRSHFWSDGLLHPRDLDAEARYLAELGEQEILLQAPVYWQKEGEKRGVKKPDAATPDAPTPDAPTPDAKVPRADLEDRILTLLRGGWDVYAAGFPVRCSAAPSLQVRSGRDWFEVDGGIDFDGFHVPLPELLKLRGKKKRQRLIRLGDGSFAIQVSEWLERWLELIGLGEIKNGVLRLRSSQAWLLDAMLEQNNMLGQNKGSVQIDEAFAKAREALRRYDRVEPKPTPKGFGTDLRHYQQEGLGWMLFLHDLGLAGCLADDMGLGKTVEVLALLEHLRQEQGDASGKPNIVVAPRSLLDNWDREAHRFCPKLKTLIWYGPGRFKVFKESYEAGFANVDLLLITYGTLRRDIEKFREIGFGYAILDEAQAIKNSSSQASKAARLLVADHRLALTGTPIENHLGEIWSLFDFLNPGMLGRSTTFKNICLASARAGAGGMAGLTEEIRKALGPFLLRRTKEEVLPDLPTKTEQVLHIELPKKQREMYDELRSYYQQSLLKGLEGDGLSDSGLDGKQMHILEALLRLRQAACHPGLIASEHAETVSGKFESLLAMLDELLSQGHKALIFSQFTGLLELLKPHLDQRGVSYEYLDGKTRDRQRRVDRFQDDKDCSLFLISIKAGGVGLNLTAADYVFVLDPWWNPAVESQAVDRAHRIGQTRKVLAYRLIATDTVEEHVASLQAEKRELVDAVMAGSGGGLRGLSVKDIQRLLG